MGRPSLNIDIAKKDREQLRTLLKGGVQQVRVVLRALALVRLAENARAPQIAKVIPLTPQAIRRLGHRYEQAGLEGALYETTTRCGPSAGHQSAHHRYGLQPATGGALPVDRRLVAEEAVKRKLAPRVGREAIRILLLHHDLKPWRDKNVVRGGPRR